MNPASCTGLKGVCDRSQFGLGHAAGHIKNRWQQPQTCQGTTEGLPAGKGASGGALHAPVVLLWEFLLGLIKGIQGGACLLVHHRKEHLAHRQTSKGHLHRKAMSEMTTQAMYPAAAPPRMSLEVLT